PVAGPRTSRLAGHVLCPGPCDRDSHHRRIPSMPTLTRRDWLRAAAVSPVFVAAGGLRPRPAHAAPKPADLKPVIDKAVKFLASVQLEDGSWFPQAGGPGLTALTVGALVRNGVGPGTPIVDRGLKYLEKNIQKDGGVYSKALATYTTCLAIMAFKEANAGGKYNAVIDAATKFVKGSSSARGSTRRTRSTAGPGTATPAA